MVKMQFYLCGVERSCLTNRLQRHFVPIVNNNNNEFRKSYPKLPNRADPNQVQFRELYDRSRRFGRQVPINPYTFESEFFGGIQILGEGFRRIGANRHANIFPHEVNQFITKNFQRLPENFSQM